MKVTSRELRELPDAGINLKRKLLDFLFAENSKFFFQTNDEYQGVEITDRLGDGYRRATREEVEDQYENSHYHLTEFGADFLPFYQEYVIYDTDPNGYLDSQDGNEMLSTIDFGDGEVYGCVWSYSSWDSPDMDKWFKLPDRELEITFEAPKPLKIKV